MNHPRLTMTFLLATTFAQLFGQDTTVFRQANASMFSNNYTFVKPSKVDNHGVFNQRVVTDDGQYWYGQGTFEESKRKIYLTFDTTKCNPRFEKITNEDYRDTLYIRWFDCWGNQQELFSIRFTDTTVHKSIFQSDLLTGFMKIPKTELKEKKLSLYILNGTRKVVDLEVSNEINQVNILANDPFAMHTFGKPKEKLSKTAKGFTTEGMWTKGKRTLFVKR